MSQSSGIPEYELMLACENTGLFFCPPNTTKHRRRILNQLKNKRDQERKLTQAQNIRDLAWQLRLQTDTLFSLCDKAGLFPVKVPTRTVLDLGIEP